MYRYNKKITYTFQKNKLYFLPHKTYKKLQHYYGIISKTYDTIQSEGDKNE